MSSSFATNGVVVHIGEKNAEWAAEIFSALSGDNTGQAIARALPPVILLVEDNPADVLLIREALKSHDVAARIFVARDGEEGIRMVDEIDEARMPSPELVILDLNLPRKSGFEVLARVRGSWRCGNKPVVVLSSSAAPRDREKAERLGASRYISKPSTLKEFLAIGDGLKALLPRK